MSDGFWGGFCGLEDRVDTGVFNRMWDELR